MTLGVTVGKFYPFHRGHEHLIRTASAQVEHLAVLVAFRPGQALPGVLRAAWIRALHPDVEVIEVLDDIPDETAPWVRRTQEVLGTRRVDVAFTSEPYGAAWARGLGATHVAVDPGRTIVPISGTALREDLGRHWSFLTPPAKAHFARRVCVLGVESSGTTTLARDLARRLGTVWVPEYGRAYWEGRATAPQAATWDEIEFVRIARTQQAMEDDLALRAHRVLVADTDALATAVWHWRYRGMRSREVEAVAAGRRPDLYLLTEPDFPFVQDGTREGEAIRTAMHTAFIEAIAASGVPCVRLGGAPRARLDEAMQAVRPLLDFAPLDPP